jgi:hypothetical protein
LCKSSPFQIFDLIAAAEFPANLFLQHLVVLSDFGGEPIQRLGHTFQDIFPVSPEGKHFFEFIWNRKKYSYEFQKLPIKELNNQRLGLHGEGLIEEKELDDLLRDMIVLLLFASTSKQADQMGLYKCEIGALLGYDRQLTTFVKQPILWLSRWHSIFPSQTLIHVPRWRTPYHSPQRTLSLVTSHALMSSI